MINRPEIFAVIGIILSIVRHGDYTISIFQHKTRPHIFSWINWALMVGIGAYAQWKLGGGPSAWVLTVVSAGCFVITCLAFFYGEKKITRTDWMAFIGVLLAIPVWLVTKNPVCALVLLIFIDCVSYYPTIRKSRLDPWSEPPRSYFWAGLRYFFVLFAVPSFKISYLFYPCFLMSSDWGLMLYLFWLREHSVVQSHIPPAEKSMAD